MSRTASAALQNGMREENDEWNVWPGKPLRTRSRRKIIHLQHDLEEKNRKQLERRDFAYLQQRA